MTSEYVFCYLYYLTDTIISIIQDPNQFSFAREILNVYISLVTELKLRTIAYREAINFCEGYNFLSNELWKCEFIFVCIKYFVMAERVLTKFATTEMLPINRIE